MVNVTFLPMNAVPQIEEQRELAIENDDHLAILLNENSIVDGQYLFHNPDGSIRMKAKRDHVRVSTMQYIPQLGSLAIGFNFGAFQIWNLMTLELEFTSQVNVECLPVTHFGFQEPCDDPRAFCYLWAVYSVADRFEEQEFPLAVMHSLTYQGKRLLDDGQYLYQDFSTSTIRFQMELSSLEGGAAGGRCVSCRTHSIATSLGEDGEDNVLNLVQLVWECWGSGAPHHAALLFDLDQWYKAQMPSTYPLQSSPFTHACALPLDRTHVLGAALCAPSVAPYASAHRLEEHFYPNSLSYSKFLVTRTHVLCAIVAPYASAHRLEEHFYPNLLSYICILHYILPLERTHVLGAPSVAPYASAHRLEEHFYPNSLSYICILHYILPLDRTHVLGAALCAPSVAPFFV
ncbi:hypothetical protein JYU34_021476 [Plutella xylostella]|uniref:ELYS beta-propeller domain-containing protein n=1 Tax=Plutella xylostella TaxID=51655 RepID=A0ABQ7PTN3_PLUXY|nr:hypothetical protein JYU34_021476 [Plutella xylostella]